MKRDRTHSACARCRSNFGSNPAIVASRIAASVKNTLVSIRARDGLARERTRVGNRESEELLEDLVHELDRMVAGPGDDRVVGKDLAA